MFGLAGVIVGSGTLLVLAITRCASRRRGVFEEKQNTGIVYQHVQGAEDLFGLVE